MPSLPQSSTPLGKKHFCLRLFPVSLAEICCSVPLVLLLHKTQQSLAPIVTATTHQGVEDSNSTSAPALSTPGLVPSYQHLSCTGRKTPAAASPVLRREKKKLRPSMQTRAHLACWLAHATCWQPGHSSPFLHRCCFGRAVAWGYSVLNDGFYVYFCQGVPVSSSLLRRP